MFHRSISRLAPALLITLLILLYSSVAAQDSTDTPKKKSDAVVIVLEEMVDQGMADYTRRAIRKAVEKKPAAIIFEVNTFGGRLDAAFDISDEIMAVRDIPTIAFVNKKAISAGALISLSCSRLYMKPSTTIGDCAPIIQGEDGPKMLGEKIQSPLRAKFRNFSQKHGYPELLAQAMVSEGLEVLKITKGDSARFLLRHEYDELEENDTLGWSKAKTMVRKGELLTLTEVEAEEYGFSSGSFETMDELLAELKLVRAEEIPISWAEKLARWLGMMAPILMLIGFGAIYMEMQSPGFGVFGIIGISSLGIVFLGKYVSGLADYTGLSLMTLGAVLIVVEMFVFPGTLIAGILGVLAFLGALALSMGGAVPLPGPEVTDGTRELLPTLIDGLSEVSIWALAALIFPVVGARYILPLLPRRSGIIVEDTLAESHVRSESAEHPEVEKGALGITISELKPTGKAEFGARPVEVTAQTGFLEMGTTIEVVRIEGQRILVRPAEKS